MDRETKIANALYIGITALLTTAMLAGALLLPRMPQGFFA